MIWNFCIRRPTLTIVIFLTIAIIGGHGFRQMPVRENPDIEFPIVSVNVVYFGAEPEVIETEILEPLEEEINTVEGLKKLTSTAREEVGTITAEFELWRDIDIATQDVRDRVNRARRELPDDIEEPIIRKLDPDAQAVMWIALTGDDRWDAVRLSRYADDVIKPRLAGLGGVGRIQIGGERRYAVRVRLDPELLSAHKLTVRDVVAAIRRNNVDIPSGRIEGLEREFIVKVHGQFADSVPFNDLIVTYDEGAPVRIRDVGVAEDGVENDRQFARFSGRTAVGLGVVKQSDANTVAVTAAVRERIEEIAGQFPAGLRYDIAADDSEYIQDSINDLLFTILLTTALVVLVVLLFLHSGWGTLITALSVPSSLLAGLMIMYILGFSVNTLTVLGLILAIGIVVDDAIVVVESTHRHGEQGVDPLPAARVGTTEVAFAAIANTLALSAVFIPVAFTSGLIGRFFYEFGLTVAATVFASTFTALTLTPMLAGRLLRAKKPGAVSRGLERVFESTEYVYGWLLDRALGHRFLTVLLALGAMGLGFWFLRQLPTEFTPAVDRGQFIINFELPEGATVRLTDAYAKRIEQILAATPEVSHYFIAVGLSRGAGPGKANQGISFVRLIPREKRKRHQSEIAQRLREELAEVPEGRAYVVEESAGASQAGAAVQLVLQHNDVEALSAQETEVTAWMRRQPQLVGVSSDLKMNKPQIDVTIKRDKANQMGVSVADISMALRFIYGEPDISEIERAKERYDVIPEVLWRGRMTPEDIGRVRVRADNGNLVSLDNVVDFEVTVGPSQINHFNRMRSATISASTPPGVALGESVEVIEGYLTENLPEDFEYAFTGQTQDFQESFANLRVTVIFSVIFIYLVLAAQFESFLHPFVILVALPLALVGAFGALWAFRMPFGIVAFIGLIMLMGMATKNGILMIDYTNVLVARGQKRIEATRHAASVRFRPVVMTTMSTVLGILPIALGYGAGGEARAPMGVAVAAGLLATTVLTLVILPVIYVLVNGLWDRIRGKGKDT